MKRKVFNKALVSHDFQRMLVKDEYGVHIYHYTHPDLEGIKIVATEHEVTLADSSWTCTRFRDAAAILVGAVTLGYDVDTFRETWSSLIERY